LTLSAAVANFAPIRKLVQRNKQLGRTTAHLCKGVFEAIDLPCNTSGKSNNMAAPEINPSPGTEPELHLLFAQDSLKSRSGSPFPASSMNSSFPKSFHPSNSNPSRSQSRTSGAFTTIKEWRFRIDRRSHSPSRCDRRRNHPGAARGYSGSCPEKRDASSRSRRYSTPASLEDASGWRRRWRRPRRSASHQRQVA